MLSISRRLTPFIIGIGTTIGLHTVQLFPKWYVHIPIFLTLFLFVFLGYTQIRRVSTRYRYYMPLAIATLLTMYGMIMVVEMPQIRFFVGVLAGIVVGSLSNMLLNQRTEAAHIHKSQRRVMMMYWVYTTFALTSSIFALGIFFRDLIPFWILTLVGGIYFGFASIMIWRMYYEQVTLSKFFLWFLVVSLMMIELIWVIHLLPVGYFAAAMYVVWPWYILQLLTRFHFSVKGVVWRKQAAFLLLNAVLYAGLFFLTRWV